MVKKEKQLEDEIAAFARTCRRCSLRPSASMPRRTSATEPIAGGELPEELQRREPRLARIREAKAALEEQAAEAERARRAELGEQGKKPRRPRDGRDPFEPKPGAQRNFTDPESKIMKTSDGSFHQCYNGQAIVDSETQVIVAAELSDQAPDAEQLQPALEQLDENLDAIGAELPENAALTADAGYFSEENIKTASSTGWTRSSRPAASSTQSRRRRRRAGLSRRTPPRSSAWHAS